MEDEVLRWGPSPCHCWTLRLSQTFLLHFMLHVCMMHWLFARKLIGGQNREFAFTDCRFLVDNSGERQPNHHNEANNVMSACCYRILPVFQLVPLDNCVDRVMTVRQASWDKLIAFFTINKLFLIFMNFTSLQGTKTRNSACPWIYLFWVER